VIVTEGKNRLALMKCYLIGPMDYVDDRGEDWRKTLTPWLEERAVIVLDPTDKPTSVAIEGNDFHEARREAILRGDYDTVTEMMKPVRAIDLRFVDESSFAVANLDLDQRPCGTYREIFESATRTTPMIIRCPQGKKEIPPWLYSEIPHQFFHETWDEVKAYLEHVNNGKSVQTFKKWKFLDLRDKYRYAIQRLNTLEGVELSDYRDS